MPVYNSWTRDGNLFSFPSPLKRIAFHIDISLVANDSWIISSEGIPFETTVSGDWQAAWIYSFYISKALYKLTRKYRFR